MLPLLMAAPGMAAASAPVAETAGASWGPAFCPEFWCASSPSTPARHRPSAKGEPGGGFRAMARRMRSLRCAVGGGARSSGSAALACEQLAGSVCVGPPNREEEKQGAQEEGSNTPCSWQATAL